MLRKEEKKNKKKKKKRGPAVDLEAGVGRQ